MADTTRLVDANDLGGVWLEGTLLTARPVGAIVRDSVSGQLCVSTNAVVATYTTLTGAGGNFQNLVFVQTVDDLPDAVAGVRTLLADTCYQLLNAGLDLLGDRIQLPAGSCAFIGTTSETSLIKSTGLGATALFTGTHTFVLQNLSITADVVFALDGTTGGSNVAYDWLAVNFVDCATIGTIENFNNFIMTAGAFLNSSGMTFDGTSDTIAFSTMLFNADAAGTVITIPATAAVSRRFRIIYSAFVVLAGETGINADSAAFALNESYILDTVSFGGGGTFLAGLTAQLNASLFTSCSGIANSADLAQYYMNANATVTTITTQSVFVKAAGTTTVGSVIAKFTHTDNRATYIGSLNNFFKITAIATLTGSANKQIALRIAKNGTTSAASQSGATLNAGGRIESTACQDIQTLVATDYFEVWVANLTDTSDVTITDLTVIIERST